MRGQYNEALVIISPARLRVSGMQFGK